MFHIHETGAAPVVRSRSAPMTDQQPHRGHDRRHASSGARLKLNTTPVATLNSSRASINQIDQAINKVSGQRGDLGAWQNQLAFTISFTENAIEHPELGSLDQRRRHRLRNLPLHAGSGAVASLYGDARPGERHTPTGPTATAVKRPTVGQTTNASRHEGRESRILGLRHVHSVTLEPRAQRRTTAWSLHFFFSQRFPDASFPFSDLDFSPSKRNPTKRFCPSVFR